MTTPNRPPKTDAELRTLANDIYYGKVFTDHHLPDAEFNEMVGMVFLPIGMMDAVARLRFADPTPGLVYQYYGVDQSELASNGWPVFFSYQRLSQEEWERMKPMFIAAADAELADFFAAPSSPHPEII